MKNRYILLFCYSIILFSCGTISHFDQTAYNQITTVEADALSLMTKANDSFSVHQKDVDDVTNKLQNAYEYDKNRPKNKISTDMWNLIIDPNGHLYGGFIARWKTEKRLDTAFISDAKKKVEENFDKIAQLESKKIK